MSGFDPFLVVVPRDAIASPAIVRAALERAITVRHHSDHVDVEIDRVSDRFGLAGSGYDPTWIERRHAERAERAAKAEAL